MPPHQPGAQRRHLTGPGLARAALSRICRYGWASDWGDDLFIGTVLEFGVLNGSYLKGFGEHFRWKPVFWGFDSFVGLPAEAEGQPRPLAWSPGSLSSVGSGPAASEDKHAAVARAVERVHASITEGFPERKVHLVPGMYSESLTPQLAARILRTSGPASFIDIDSDLYISARQALDWVFEHGLARVGTVIRYDDWWTLACATRNPRNRNYHRDAASIESYGGEPLAHEEVAHRHGVTFACACGPCDAESGGPMSRYFATGHVGFNPFFRVAKLSAPPGNTGFAANGTMVGRFLDRMPVCRNYRSRGSFALSSHSNTAHV